ncbi:DUF1638 domain-containing protein [Aquibaculum sediminis]|uniref:DUF1638 domain-containing protein n=1 Tax=Aquibaculum sediminis TaxID=3231907 RepID=UPI003453BD87
MAQPAHQSPALQAPEPASLRPASAFALAPAEAASGLIIACGAVAREIIDCLRLNGCSQLRVTCLPAIWHNRPERIPEGVRAKIRAARAQGVERIFVAYGDCGTGGLLDRVLEEEGGERLPGPHCYAFFSGQAVFQEQAERDPTAFYLTDYLARHFDSLIIRGLGLDRHPELLPDYFGNYSRLVYLAQTPDPALASRAEDAAARLGLAYEYRFTGLGELGDFVARAAAMPQEEDPDRESLGSAAAWPK